MKAYDLAEQAFRKAVSLEADYYNGYVNLGNVYLLAGRKAEAEEAFRKAREIRPEAE